MGVGIAWIGCVQRRVKARSRITLALLLDWSERCKTKRQQENILSIPVSTDQIVHCHVVVYSALLESTTQYASHQPQKVLFLILGTV